MQEVRCKRGMLFKRGDASEMQEGRCKRRQARGEMQEGQAMQKGEKREGQAIKREMQGRVQYKWGK
jgi:hypothetical protein